MESHHNHPPISTLKVDFHCSKECPAIVKKRLEKFNGVESISVDAKQGMVTVAGDVDPKILIKLLAKMGQKAELWSFQKEPRQDKGYWHAKQNNHGSHRNLSSHCCCDDYSNDDDSSDSNDCNCKRMNNVVCWEDPQLKGSSTYSTKTKKKKSGWKKWLGFGNSSEEPKFWIKSPRRPINFPAPPPINTYNYNALSLMHLHRSMAYGRPPPPPMYANPASSYGYYHHPAFSSHGRQYRY